MKVAIVVAFLAIACFAFSEANFAPPSLERVARLRKMHFAQAIAPAAPKGKPCECKSRPACNGGEVNHEVECHPNYIMVCCVIPEL